MNYTRITGATEWTQMRREIECRDRKLYIQCAPPPFLVVYLFVMVLILTFAFTTSKTSLFSLVPRLITPCTAYNRQGKHLTMNGNLKCQVNTDRWIIVFVVGVRPPVTPSCRNDIPWLLKHTTSSRRQHRTSLSGHSASVRETTKLAEDASLLFWLQSHSTGPNY